MTCQNCGFCKEDLDTLANLATDAKSRGAYKVAQLLERAINKCDRLCSLPANDFAYVQSIERVLKSDEWNIDSKLECAKDAQRLVIERKELEMKDGETQRSCGFLGMLEDVFGSPKEEVEPKAVIRGFGRGFIGQLEEALTGTPKEEIKSPTIVRHIPVGFKAMLEDACDSQSKEEVEQPKRVRGFGRGRGYSEQLEEVFASKRRQTTNP